MPPDEPNDEERAQELPEDNGTPFQPADPVRDADAPADSSDQPGSDSSNSQHPATDTGVDETELYQDGEAAATGQDAFSDHGGVADFNEEDDDVANSL